MHVRGRTPRPVFVDRTGRRRRLFAVAGAAGGLLLALASLMLVAGFTGVGPGRVPPLPAPPTPAASKVPRAVVTARPPATVRSSRQAWAPATTGAPDPGTTGPAPPVSTTPQPAVTPNPAHTNNGRWPTHWPGHKPTKGT